MAETGWISRKRKRRTGSNSGSKSIPSTTTGNDDTTLTSANPSQSLLSTNNNTNNANDTKYAVPSTSSSSSTTTDSSSASAATIPASLMPHLGWTKVSSCRHVARKKKRMRNGNDNWDRREGLQRVAGRAVFFLHDPRPGGGTSERDESKIWFQGRFFPSTAVVGRVGGIRRGGGWTRCGTRDGNSPTSVDDAPSSGHGGNNDNNDDDNNNNNIGRTSENNSWGLLAVQNEITDECLTCSEGGYRELDLTFLRRRRRRPKTTLSKTEKKKTIRWVARDVTWTGGNMMTLSTDLPHRYYDSSLSGEGPGVKFEPRRLMEGRRARGVAEKYFPEMVKRLRIRDVMMMDEDGRGGEDDAATNSEAMVIIGDMEVVAPTSFVKMRSGVGSYGNDSEEDGLWDDE